MEKEPQAPPITGRNSTASLLPNHAKMAPIDVLPKRDGLETGILVGGAVGGLVFTAVCGAIGAFLPAFVGVFGTGEIVKRLLEEKK